MLGKFQSPWTSEMEPLLSAFSLSASPSQRLKPTVLSLEPGILPYSVPTCGLPDSQGHTTCTCANPRHSPALCGEGSLLPDRCLAPGQYPSETLLGLKILQENLNALQT